MKTLQLSTAFLLAASVLPAATSLSIDPPSALVSGQPGQTVGWGFTITNDTNYLAVNSVQFLPSSPYGTFIDLLGPRFLIIGPAPESPSISETWDGILGLGSFAISNASPTGVINVSINVGYDLYSVSPNDPNFNPDTDTLATGLFFDPVTASINITNDPGPTVPEPATTFLFSAALAYFASIRYRCVRVRK